MCKRSTENANDSRPKEQGKPVGKGVNTTILRALGSPTLTSSCKMADLSLTFLNTAFNKRDTCICWCSWNLESLHQVINRFCFTDNSVTTHNRHWVGMTRAILLLVYATMKSLCTDQYSVLKCCCLRRYYTREQ